MNRIFRLTLSLKWFENRSMETIILEIPDPKDKAVLLLLAGRLNCKVIEPEKKIKKTDLKKDTAKILDLFKEISKNGNLKKTISDPVKWQKEIRKDRKLPGR